MNEEKTALAQEITRKQELQRLADEQRDALALRLKLMIWSGSYTREEIHERLPQWSDEQLDTILWFLLTNGQIRKIARDRYRLTYEGRRS